MRILTSSDIIFNTRKAYLTFMGEVNRKNGICFGGTFYWAVDTLRYAGKNKKIKDVLMRDVRNFYGFGIYVQNHFKLNKFSNMSSVIKMLNEQELFLSKTRRYDNSAENKLKHSRVSGAEAKKIVNKIIDNHSGYENTALVFSMRLKKGKSHLSANELHGHCAAIINYEGRVYFYDINTGVYLIPKPDPCPVRYENLVLTIAKTFELDEKYIMADDKRHVFIKTDND